MTMSLAEMCRLVAYYGDISEANRKRWARHKGTRLFASLMSDADLERTPEQEKAPGGDEPGGSS